MRMRTALIASLIAVVVNCLAQDKPKLVRGENYIEVPAIADGLCVSNLFQSNMVVQRDKPIAVWGWAAPGEAVTVSFGDKTANATAGDDRAWKVELPAFPANAEPQVMTVAGKDSTLTLENILVGDVWVLGGQSNMEFEIAKVVDGDLEIASANFPEIRMITVPQQDGAELQKGFPKWYKWSSWSSRHFPQGYWEVCSPETVRSLSAIGYVFARRIHMVAQVPIGVVDASRGGTTVETWTPDSVLRAMETPEVKSRMEEWDKKVAEFDPQKDLEDQIKRHEAWVERMKKQGKEANKPAPSKPRPGPAFDQNRPGNCYASIMAPLTGLAVKGAIWHQGYNNAFQPNGHVFYHQVFPKMIEAWRNTLNDPKMPFGIISLCTGGSPQDASDYLQQMADEGTYIRSVQYQTYVDLKNAGDENIGFASSFDQRRSWYHPQIKVPVGERIARWALATQYGMKLKWEPPVVKEVKPDGGKLILTLSENVGPHNDGPMVGFAIAGEDGKFQLADADYLVTGKDNRGRPQKDRKTVVLSSPLVPNPVHFRHAWARNPMANVKANGIPLATVRSDSWTLMDQYKSYTGNDTKMPNELDRAERGELSKALKAADLERRTFLAKQLIEEQTKSAEGEKK